MFIKIICATQAIFAFFVLSIGAAQAATLIVDNTTDDAALSACTSQAGDCSLRGAIAAAASGDNVTFDSGLFMSRRTIRLTNDDLQIDKDLTITGVGGVIVVGDSASLYPTSVFTILNGTVSLSGMTVTGGGLSGINNFFGTLTLTDMIVTNNTGGSISGGGISNFATLNLVNSIVSDNASTEGGGVVSLRVFYDRELPKLTVLNSIISGNTARNGFGGGINISRNSSVTIANSAIIGNSAYGAGGIFGNATIMNTTVSGNQAIGYGGGISCTGGNWMNVTVVNNTAGNQGGGVSLNGRDLILANSLIAKNAAQTNPDIAGTFTSQGNNLVQTRGASTGYIASDLPDGINPMLAPLANNGGFSPTHALLSNSPAINAGNNALAVGTTDQRGEGFKRIVRGKIDIGAFEYK